MELQHLIAALSRPAAYPHQPAKVEMRQTHASVLFFADDLVYKLKKPVNLGFLDFSTLDRRRHFCEEELRLNRRLAPEMYLRIAHVIRATDGQIRIAAPGETTDSADIIDYTVEMRRLSDDRMLDHLLATGAAGEPEINAIAHTLARFHADAATGRGIDEHGTPEAISRQLRRNLDQLKPFVGHLPDSSSPDSPVLSTRAWDHLARRIDTFLAANDTLLRRRVETHRIRDGHGDLHTGNICMAGAPTPATPAPIIYDCIEFDPSLRCCDVASDIAFLAMDLDHRGRRDLSAHFIARYAALAADPDIHALQPLYRAHFALVRAKVTAIRARDASLDPRDRNTAWCDAAAYTHLAIGYTLPPSVIIMMGLPATGKSWLAHRLAAPLAAVLLRSDELRKQLAGRSPTARAAGPERDHLYSADMTERTYTEMHRLAAAALAAGSSIVLDATHSTSAHRRRAIELAEDSSAPWLIIHTTAPDSTIQKRMAARARDPAEVSDADYQIYLKARETFEPPTELPRHRIIEAHPAITPEVTISRALDALIR